MLCVCVCERYWHATLPLSCSLSIPLRNVLLRLASYHLQLLRVVDPKVNFTNFAKFHSNQQQQKKHLVWIKTNAFLTRSKRLFSLWCSMGVQLIWSNKIVLTDYCNYQNLAVDFSQGVDGFQSIIDILHCLLMMMMMWMMNCMFSSERIFQRI